MEADERLITAHRLGRVAVDRSDLLLDALRFIAVGSEGAGLGVPVTLLVDGVLIRGTTASELEAARRLDRAIAAMIQPTDVTDESTVELANLFAEDGPFEGIVQHREDRLRESLAFVDDLAGSSDPAFDLTTIPQHVAVDYAQARKTATALMLTDAHIYVANGWQLIGDLRVVIDHIGAWWPNAPQGVSESEVSS